jgi:hypothetical protein
MGEFVAQHAFEIGGLGGAVLTGVPTAVRMIATHDSYHARQMAHCPIEFPCPTGVPRGPEAIVQDVLNTAVATAVGGLVTGVVADRVASMFHTEA